MLHHLCTTVLKTEVKLTLSAVTNKALQLYSWAKTFDPQQTSSHHGPTQSGLRWWGPADSVATGRPGCAVVFSCASVGSLAA
jgi:hypothetical protein